MPSSTSSRTFYDAYRGAKNVSPLVTRLPRTHHLILLSQTKHAEDGPVELQAIRPTRAR
jgi:hypothetical protein